MIVNVFYVRFEKNTKASADKLTKKNFKLTKHSQYSYQSLVTDTKHIIKVKDLNCHNKCSCSCKSFIKLGVCLHLVAISFLFELNFIKGNYIEAPEVFVQKTKKGKKRTKYGRALDKELLEYSLQEEVEIEELRTIEEIVEAEAIVIAVQPKKKARGRPPKSIEQIRVITPVPVKDALLEPVIIRRSSRNIK